MPFEGVKRITLAYFWNKNEGVSALHFALHFAKRFAQEPFDMVSLYAFSVFFTDRNPHRHLICRTVYDRQRGGKRPFSLGKKFLEIRLFFQSLIFHFCGFPPSSQGFIEALPTPLKREKRPL